MKENEGIKEAIEEAKKRDRERREGRLDRLLDKSIDQIENALELDEDDPSLSHVKIRAIEVKNKLAENHLVRMGYKVNEEIDHKHSGTVKIEFEYFDTPEETEDDIDDDAETTPE